MSLAKGAIEAGGAMPPATVKVWDPFVRLFHWSLAALFVAAYATGDESERAHMIIGYAMMALLALRVVWGFVGPAHARFADFLRSPREVSAYLRDMASLRARRYLGHNPAGGVMIVVLLAMLCFTGATGYMMTLDALWGAEWLEDVHEAAANLTLALVGLHVAGVLASGLLHGENLVKAMFTGRKRAGEA